MGAWVGGGCVCVWGGGGECVCVWGVSNIIVFFFC